MGHVMPTRVTRLISAEPVLQVVFRFACITMYYMATITLRVPDALDKALERQSAAAGVSKSDLAREALRRFLAVSEFKRLRVSLVRRAQAQGAHTDEEIFRVLAGK